MRKAICVVFTVIQMIIVSLLLFAAGSTDYYIKRDQLYSNPVYAAAGIIFAAGLCLIIKMSGERLEELLHKRQKTVVAFTLLIFFLLSVVLDISGFFYSDWDPIAILYALSELISGSGGETVNSYFSNHPNNLLLVWIYLMVMKTAGVFGYGSFTAIVIFQCLVSSFTAFVVWRIMSDICIGSRVMPYVGLLLYEVWIGLSPWFIVTYSDETGIILPVIILRLFQKLSQGRASGNPGGELFIWGAVSFAAGVGYFIKPQIIIAYIAGVLFCFCDSLYRGAGHEKVLKNGGNRAGLIKRGVAAAAVSGMTVLFSFFIVKGAIFPSMDIKLDGDRSFGMAHYFMMGLNRETDGAYSDEDTLYTDSFDTPREKLEADLELAGKRIREYGILGLKGHAQRKILVNYNDGLFAWGIDGNFFAGREAEELGNVAKTPLTDFVWSFILPEGADHGKYSSALQMLWLMMLILSTVSAVFAGRHLRMLGRRASGGEITIPDEIYIVMLSLTGLFLFELLFEAKARYLFIYTPYYLILSVFGLFAVLKGMRWVR